MEVNLFKKNEMDSSLFNKIPFKTVSYTNIDELKNEKYGNFKDLDATKCKIDLLDKNLEKYRRASAKYLHEYELIKNISKKQVISRAYYKLYEMIYYESFMYNDKLQCFFICEAPGGFIECVSDIRRKKNLRTEFLSVSKYDDLIKYDRYIEEKNLMYSDITNVTNINEIIAVVSKRFPHGLDLITADGGFDVKNFNAQELITSKLLLCEIFLALNTQKVGGTFIIKFFDMFSHNSMIFYLLLCSHYNYVKIIKPKSSRNCNSERYLFCSHFNGISNETKESLLEIINNFKISENEVTLLYPDFDFSKIKDFSKKISTFNNLILYEQIKTINESIKMVNNKDSFFQNLLLNIFAENKKNIHIYNNIFQYKNILNSRIKKCISFLRLYNINTNQIPYRLV
jgi:23S rRNA U2552 (ribose-2'-O)-methylase RlmE/FtsJ